MPYTRVVRSGANIEVYEYAFRPPPPSGNRKKAVRRAKPKATTGVVATSLLRRVDNVYRGKRNFQRLVRSNFVGDCNPALVTLTMFEVLPLSHAYAALSLFIKRLRRVAGKVFRYVIVPEFQKRGAVHFHALIWGVDNALIINERNDRIFQRLWQRGFVDCIPTDGSPKLVGYLAKYMSKAMFDDRLFGEKAYVASRNALRPVLYKIDEEFDDVSDFFLPVYKLPSQDKEYMAYYIGKGRYRLYKDLDSDTQSSSAAINQIKKLV